MSRTRRTLRKGYDVLTGVKKIVKMWFHADPTQFDATQFVALY